MPKPKMTSGWLCRDTKASAACIVFYPDPETPAPVLGRGGMWRWGDRRKQPGLSVWTPEEWAAIYNTEPGKPWNLAPPKPGCGWPAELQL